MRLVLDANLLVLLAVGDVDTREIATHRRLQSYTADDYRLLLDAIGRFASVRTFPNLLTEASNLLRQCSEHRQARFGAALAAFAEKAAETYEASRDAVRHPFYSRLGLTDAVVLSALTANDHLLTADLDLYLAALRSGFAAENFAHLRDGAYGA